MAEESMITAEMRSQIGKESEDVILEVEKRVLQMYLDAVEDANPRWQDIAPPNLLCTVLAGAGAGRAELQTSYPRLGLPSGDELELFRPIRVGDVITSRAKLADIQERVVRDGSRRLTIIVEATYTNQKGELVGKNRSLTMSWRPKQA